MQIPALTSFFIFLIPFAAASSLYVPSDNCTDRANTSVLANISLRIYPGKTIDQNSTVLIGNASDLLGEIDPSKKTVLYIHAWTESSSNKSVKAIIDAYLKRQDHNILIVDWGHIAAQEWSYATQSVKGIGYTLATALNELVSKGLNSRTLHIVGHALGGQIPGFIGRYVDFTVPRITGLDSARFEPFVTADEYLSSSDANFVDVIHTDADFYGIDYNIGHIDFYPNGGSSPQPGCEREIAFDASGCSHPRSWVYYAESLLNETAFLAVSADSYASFANGSVSDTQVYMGYATPTTARGDFYLQTNRQAPFGRGAEGITFYEE